MPDEPEARWGRSVIEPDRAHLRDGDTLVVDGVAVGFAVCGAFLVGDLPDAEAAPKCSTCLAEASS